MSQTKILVLLTNTYPYGYGESFLETEIHYLSRSFEVIYICPFRSSVYTRNIPKNVHVVDTLTKGKKIFILLGYIFQTLVSEEFQNAIRRLRVDRKILNFSKAVLFFCKALYIRDNIMRLVSANGLKYDEIVFYSYWLTSGAFGLGLAKKQQAGIKLVARAHGYDLYAERYLTQYIPFQIENINNLDKLYLISNHGYKYLSDTYKENNFLIKEKSEISRLGVKKGNPKIIRKKSNLPYRIVTCSSFIRTKRLDLLINALTILDRSFEKKTIEWHHIGGGRGRKWIENKIKRKKYQNISCRFHGILSNEEVLKFYYEQWVDVFVNVSDSEGIPVSIMEAMSYGIPVVARNVGGISEIVNSENGMLLDQVISPQCLADDLLKIMSAQEEWLAKRRKAFETWGRKFNADKNYKVFVASLINT